MIASLEGVLRLKREDNIVVETGGVGLEVHVPSRTALDIGSVGEIVSLFAYMHVREDSIVLYGFSSEEDKSMFLSLIGISGIGPKVAMSILSSSTASELAGLICGEDTAALTSFPGIGRKTSERIILELKDKIDASRFGAAPVETGVIAQDLADEVVAALCSLGFTRAAALKGIKNISNADIPDSPGVEDIVREVLKRTS
jgi:Holliday junction DNA helicase RuvA